MRLECWGLRLEELGIDNGELYMQKWQWVIENWELRFEKSGMWELRVESWEQGVVKSESSVELGIEN